MEKQEYVPAELEVIQFNTEDIIITSPVTSPGGNQQGDDVYDP